MTNLSTQSNTNLTNTKQQAPSKSQASQTTQSITDKDMTEQTVMDKLGLVKSKEELLALFQVKPYPVMVNSDSATNKKVNQQRNDLYYAQYERSKQLYLATETVRPTYLVQQLKSQFGEYEHFLMSAELDKRGKVDIEQIRQLWSQLHIVDDMITELVQTMPAHKPVGWQVTSQSRNYLRLPTVGRVRYGGAIADQTSLCSYVLGHFGVMSYTYDRAYYIGHVLGYLFICYYFAYLSIGYGVTPLAQSSIIDFEYNTLKTPYLVRLLQTLDGESKKRIYQLAMICAKLSRYATDKRIEKLLIAEVNDFNKKEQKQDLERWLAEGVRPLPIFDDESLDSED